MGVNFEDFAEKEALHQREVRSLHKRIVDLSAEREELRKHLALVNRLQEHSYRPPLWLAPKRKAKGHRATACVLLADTHYGEVVSADEVDHLNAYDDRIAEMRTRKAFEKMVTMSRDYLAGVSYDGCVLFLGGDIVSGVIHEELNETNSMMMFEQVLFATDLLVPGIRMLESHFGKVHVLGVVGNHGRRTRKPRYKGRAQDNADWLVYMMLLRAFEQSPNVTVDVPNAMDAHLTIYDTRYVLTHGDQFRGGSGISGALSPLLLGAHRKTRREASAGRPYDVMVMGHWHQRISLPSKGLLVGGCLKGLDEYGYGHNFEAEPPTAEFWLTSPEHGITVTAPLFVSDRKAEKW